MIRLFFQGELATSLVMLLAVVVGASVGAYYYRETRSLAFPHRWLLPILRGLAIAMVIMMLAGPVLEYRRETGMIPTVHVFVDASDSMKFQDTDTDNSKIKLTPRMDRAGAILFGSETNPGWLSSVKDSHRVKVSLLSGNTTEAIYDSESPDPPPKALPGGQNLMDRTSTNLGDPVQDELQSLIAGFEVADSKSTSPVAGESTGTASDDSSTAPDAKKGSHQAILILSDGQHNVGQSPEAIAARLGDASVPVFTVGFGQSSEPIDLAVLDMDAPPLVASNGRATGSILLKDLGNQGDRYKVRITSGEKTVWEKSFTTESLVNRRIPFDFPVADLVGQTSKDSLGTIETTRTTIPLQVSIDTVSGEYDLTNNAIEYRMSASTRTRRVLIVDSRSRWETRYIRNVFERDPTWAVETIILWPNQIGVATLDDEQAAFPEDQKALAVFDVIVWGDVDPTSIASDQMDLVREFVAQGGGLVFIDGDRDHLSLMKDTPIGDLIPVRFATNPRHTDKMRLTLTTTGSERAAMKLLTDPAAGSSELEAVWSGLQPPTTLRNVTPLPGAEVWLEAELGGLQSDAPVLVTRLFGAGQVIYMATDQTWRWRYRVADRYHARFWNQLLESVMQAPFDVRDQYVALATGAAQYRAGERATIRVQLRDSEGKPETDAIVDALLKREGSEATVTPLRLVDASRGVYQGETEPLDPGDYTTSVRAAGYAASASVTSSFLVAKPINRENVRLAQNATLLNELASVSGGVYADASDVQKVWDAIRPLSDGKIEIKRFAIAQSFFWFFAVLGLLAMEWWLRKKVGLI